jgi:type I restriction-modification system DNA methylase subunit
MMFRSQPFHSSFHFETSLFVCPRNADSFRSDLHPDLKADFILANPPFNMSDWGGENLQKNICGACVELCE